MSTVPSTRSARSRILAVGPMHVLPGDGAPAVEQMDSIFEALGTIAVCPASRPVEAVLLAPEESEDPGELVHSAEAIRRLDATVQIVIVSDQPLSPSIAGAFDGHLAPPVDTSPLLELLGGRIDTNQPPPPPLVEAPPTVDTSIGTSTSTGDLDAIAPVQSNEEGMHQLGDTDLVEAMLHDARGVRPLALRLIMQQTGWTECFIDIEGKGEPIQFGGGEYGSLVVPGRTPDEIRPWASWIARWLALDEAQRELRDMAFRDELTAAWNRRYLASFLEDAIEEARQLRRQLTVMVFDIDDFKSYNDQFGHAAGDIILRNTVQLLSSVIRDGDRVCRTGGDEFAVVFADMQAPRQPGSAHPDSVETIARRFQEQVCNMRFPELGLDAPGTLSISGGLASFPWDGHDGNTLLRRADERAIESKRRGKNCMTIGPGARQDWPEDDGAAEEDPDRQDAD
ncbi:MAG: GGDEF domain-containing protein [Planctomycetota bacterium]|nr:GGDEF domain-containing protein [Planctomycetota bacterium]